MAEAPHIDAEEHLKLAAKLVQLDAAVAYCQKSKIDWMEVEEDVLRYFNKGEVPASGYFVYKNVKLCLKGTAEEIAKRDGLNCFNIVFPKDSYTKVGVKPGLK